MAGILHGKGYTETYYENIFDMASQACAGRRTPAGFCDRQVFVRLTLTQTPVLAAKTHPLALNLRWFFVVQMFSVFLVPLASCECLELSQDRRHAHPRGQGGARHAAGWPSDNAFNVFSSKSVISRSVGRGASNALAMASMILREGLALPLVRSERNETDMPALVARSFLCMPNSSSNRRTLVKKIWLYTGRISKRKQARHFSR